MSTVLEAYHILEREGWIEVRPQSGHFVCARNDESQIRHVPEVSIDDRIARIFQELANPRVIPFGAAVPSDAFLPLARIARSLARSNRAPDSHRYEDPKGNARLRRLLAVRFSSGGRLYTENDVVITNGCTEALSLSLLALAVRGDAVLVESPAYFGIYQILEWLGLRAIEVPSSVGTGTNPEAFARAVHRHRPRAAVLIPNFSNPTGSLMPPAAKREIMEIARKEGVAIIEDDIYGEIGYGEERPPSLLSLGEAPGITCGSVSKIISPGLRIGWAISREFSGRLIPLKRILNMSTNRPAQSAVLDLMQKRSYDAHLRRMRRTLADLSIVYTEALKEALPDAEIVRPRGGFVLWIRTPADTGNFVRTAAREGISLIPGSLFDASGSHRHCFRLNCGVEWNTRTRTAIRTLGRIYRETYETDTSRSARKSSGGR